MLIDKLYSARNLQFYTSLLDQG
ncbi:MAG: hypothetical protein RLZZ203_352, partial [Cyanobacteriota bacterium]